MSKKIKIAVTGGIGSGKSLFADFFIQKGFTVLKADDISKSKARHLINSVIIYEDIRKSTYTLVLQVPPHRFTLT